MGFGNRPDLASWKARPAALIADRSRGAAQGQATFKRREEDPTLPASGLRNWHRLQPCPTPTAAGPGTSRVQRKWACLGGGTSGPLFIGVEVEAEENGRMAFLASPAPDPRASDDAFLPVSNGTS